MKHSHLLALTAWPVLASCAAKTPAPLANAGAVAVTAPVALGGGLRVTPIEAAPAEIAAHGSGIWKFNVETPPSNPRAICEVDLLRGGRVVERVSRTQNFVPAPGTKFAPKFAMIVALDLPQPLDNAPEKMNVTVSRQDGSAAIGVIETVNNPFVGALFARAWSGKATPQKDGSFLLVGANSNYAGADVYNAAHNDLNLVCCFRLNSAPPGKLASVPSQIPFALVADKVEFKRARADLSRNGWAYDAKIAIGYRGPRPDWWGREAGVNWAYDSGLALNEGKLRRIKTSNGTLTTAGSEPHYNPTLDKYVNSALIAYSEIKGRAGKLIFVQEMIADKKPAGAIYQTISAPQFAARRETALAAVKVRALVPPL